MNYRESTPYETEIIAARQDEFLPALVHLAPVAIQRYKIVTVPEGARVSCETNDDNDDGYPDGHWVTWEENYNSVEQALKLKGKCRVGISGVIVTVMVDGKEIR